MGAEQGGGGWVGVKDEQYKGGGGEQGLTVTLDGGPWMR